MKKIKEYLWNESLKGQNYDPKKSQVLIRYRKNLETKKESKKKNNEGWLSFSIKICDLLQMKRERTNLTKISI